MKVDIGDMGRHSRADVAPVALRNPLARSFYSAGIGLAVSAVGALIRTPLTISTIGAESFGVVSTILSLCTWLQMSAASARIAGTAAAAPLDYADDVIDRTSATIFFETTRTYAPLALALVVAAVVAPVSLVDPSHQQSELGVRASVVIGVVIAILSAYGSARIGAQTTHGKFRTQNLSYIASFGVTTIATLLAAGLKMSPVVFTTIWMVSLATPGVFQFYRMLRLRPLGSHSSRTDRRFDRQKIRSMVASGSWIVIGQQLGNGMDLIIVTAVIGSFGSAQYGLTWRVLQVLIVPAIAGGPILTRAAVEARAGGSTARCRNLVVFIMLAEIAALSLFIPLHTLVYRVLGAGQVGAPNGLLFAGVVWVLLEICRRIVLALSATAEGLRTWRRLSIVFAVPNLAVSVLMTLWLGVPGPLVGSCVGVIGAVVFGTPAVRELLRSATAREAA